MFYPSPVLFKRTAVRLKGFKPPAIKLLKESYDFVHPSTLTPPIPTPHWQPRAGMSNHQAWDELRMPILAIQRHPLAGGLDVDFQGEGSGIQTENAKIGPVSRIVGAVKVGGEREEQVAEDAKRVLETADVPAIVLKKQRRRESELSCL